MLPANPSVPAPDKQMNLAIRLNNRYNFLQQTNEESPAKE
jgi:hypothetical protein